MLDFRGVSLSRAGRQCLNRCSFEALNGEILGIAGPTGSGKSALLQIAAGVTAPERGILAFEGRDVTRSLDLLRSVAGLAGENLPGPYDVTGRVWLELWRELDCVPRGEHRQRLKAALAIFPVSLSLPIQALSCGERQRLALLRLWCRRPKLFLLDHPSAPLDGYGLLALTQSLKKIVEEGHTVMLAESSPHLLTAVCDRVALLRQGEVIAVVERDAPTFAADIASTLGWAS